MQKGVFFMRFNRQITAAALGALATLVGELVTWMQVRLGAAPLDMYSIDSLLITLNRESFWMGFVVNFIVGGAIAVLLNWALSRYGADNVVNKAIAATLMAWFLLRLFATAFIEGRVVDPRPLAQYAVHLAGAVGTGVALGVLFKLVLAKGSARAR